jgi:hypothetical protein
MGALRHHGNAPDRAFAIVDALPTLLPGAELSITCMTEYVPPAGGGLAFQAVTFDLNEEVTFSAAETYRFPGSSDDTFVRSVFECRPDGHTSGDLDEWMDLVDSHTDPVVLVQVDHSQTAASGAQDAARPVSTTQMYPDDLKVNNHWDLGTLSIETRLRCGILPTVTERTQEAADLVSSVLQGAMNDIVVARTRAKARMSAPMGALVIFGLTTCVLAVLGEPAWLLTALASMVAGLLAASEAGRVAGFDSAISNFETRLRREGVSVSWERRDMFRRAAVRWRSLELLLIAATGADADPD